MTPPSYDNFAKTLHWLMALLILGLLLVGWTMEDAEGSTKFMMFQMHKSVGITLLLLSFVRLGWRLMHKAPALPAGMKRWEVVAAKGTHHFFYLLMIIMPLTGWAIVSSSPLNIPTMLYGVVPWPHLPILPDLPNKREVGHMIGEVHGALAVGIVFLLALHVGAALKHHFIVRDDVVLRMAPRFTHRLLNLLRGMK